MAGDAALAQQGTANRPTTPAGGTPPAAGALQFPLSEPWPSATAAGRAGAARASRPTGASRSSATALVGEPPRLTDKPVRLVASGRTLVDLQPSLEAALGVRVILTSGAASQSVTGEITGEDGMAFLKELSSRLRLEWAFSSDAIFLAPEGASRAVVFNAPTPVIAFRAAALANQEFEPLVSGARVVARKEEITVTGIPAWINQVAALRVPSLVDFVQRTMAQHEERQAAEKAKADEGKAAATPKPELVVRNLPAERARPAETETPEEPLSLMVFRLNNAYVDDKQLSVGSTRMTIPGVATLFRQFTGLGGGDGTSAPPQPTGGASRLPRLASLAGGRNERRPDLDEAASRPARGGVASRASEPVVIADSRMNALMVRDRASMLEPYKALVKVLDQPTDMVQLDAFVIDIKASRLDEFGLGLSWGGSSTLNSPGLAPGGAVPAAANLILQAARGAQLLAQIRALETRGDSEILTVPSVVTLNNLEATFSARQNFFVKVSGNQDASLTQVTAETLLKVTPLVAQAEPAAGRGNGSERRIRLLISVQDGAVDASASAVVDNLPRTLENQISTQAVVRGGDTLVIGGQVVRKRVNRVSGLPIIRDIPVLGALTSSRSEDFEQYVRIYVVRPRILGDGSTPQTEPEHADSRDPLVHGIVGRVPELIRGSGLSPSLLDAQRAADTRPAAEATLVVPLPGPKGAGGNSPADPANAQSAAGASNAGAARVPASPGKAGEPPPAAMEPAAPKPTGPAATPGFTPDPALSRPDDVPPPGPAGC